MATIIRHLVGFDLRALRRPLAVWGLALACQAAVLLLGPDRLGVDPRLRINYDMAALIVRFALTAVLAALLVHSDALVGTTAFWRTRPIPRRSLLASKLLSAMLWLVAVPSLVLMGILLMLGLSGAAAMRGAAVIGAEQALLTVFALVAAAVTANLAHFVIASLAGFTLVTLASAFLPVLATLLPAARSSSAWWVPLVFMGAAVAGAVLATLHQFLTLRTGRSVTVIAVALLAATAGASLFRRAPAPTPRREVDPAVFTAGDVRVELESTTWGSFTRLFASTRQTGWQLGGFVNLSGEPDAILLRPVAIDSTLAIGGRPSARWDSATAAALVNAGSADARTQPYRSVRAALGGIELGVPFNVPAQKHRLALIEIGESIHRELQDAPGTLDVALVLRAFRYVVTARSPVAPGGSLRMRDRRATILALDALQAVVDTDPPREGLNLALRDTDVTSLGAFTFGTPPGHFVLYNESRRQAVVAMPRGQQMFRATLGLLGTLSPFVRTGSLQLEYDPAQSDASFAVDDEWIRGAELLRLEPEDLGVLTRPLRLEGLRTERPRTVPKSPNA